MEEILVCPVSGGSFCTQLGILSRLCDVTPKYRPTVAMGTSGGLVCIYTAIAGDWNTEGLIRMVTQLRPSMLCNAWLPEYFTMLPSLGVGYKSGSIYSAGEGIEELFSVYFTPHTIGKVEVWSGTYNVGKSRAELFCNRSKELSYLSRFPFEPDRNNALPLHYLDFNVEKIASVAHASSSIPVLVPEKVIDKQRYIDGGVVYASPFTPLLRTIASIPKNIHILYVNCQDNTKPLSSERTTLFGNTGAVASDITRSLNIQDRNNGIMFVGGDSKPKKEGKLETIEDLSLVLEERQQYKRTFLELYPLNVKTVNITKYTEKDLIEAFSVGRTEVGYRFWHK